VSVQPFRKSAATNDLIQTSIIPKLASDTGISASERTYVGGTGVPSRGFNIMECKEKEENKKTTLMNVEVIWTPK
jgi:hypothetical protein